MIYRIPRSEATEFVQLIKKEYPKLRVSFKFGNDYKELISFDDYKLSELGKKRLQTMFGLSFETEDFNQLGA